MVHNSINRHDKLEIYFVPKVSSDTLMALVNAVQMTKNGERDYNSYTLLTFLIERKFLAPLTSCITAREVWDRLLEDHEYKSSENIHESQCQFFNPKLEPDQSTSSFIAQLELTVSKSRELGDTAFSNAFMISKLTANLPTGFDGFTTTWEITSKEDRTLSLI